MKRVILIVLDSVGIGEMPDAHVYGDVGSNTLGNIAKVRGGLHLPHLQKLGLGNIELIQGVAPLACPDGSYGKMAERSPGKDTTTGHWEMAGVILAKAFPTFPQGFPDEFVQAFAKRIGREVIGNEVASGTEIIQRLGQEHVTTGKPIVYTSADSVFQIAAHEEIISLDELYRICEIAREMLDGDLRVGRVIARPFLGTAGSFYRTTHRHDYAIEPPHTMLLDGIKEKGLQVMAVGKIKDIYAGRGVTLHVPSISNKDGVDKTLDFMGEGKPGLIMTNLVDFDMLYGHRNDVEKYALAIEEFDARLPEILAGLGEKDILMITADHGCDPTTASTDHSREYVPLLVYGKQVNPGVNLGVRSSFADLGATIAEYLGTDQLRNGQSFLDDLFQV
ncbi:phosphopentomutase [Desulfitobacterium dichloroeliminans LMG P-21439]|uniref:Phosphopentomutase n=1 Tax=Desulfitobacterium dichloroeliminans (strain LMG P-21439 / DCA1) TaxID=871963 RepID=L0FA40_DESDL|nr:phosphopentomutase [Desulfitobacterium dichloroeliminans]AGA69818.1 phosphopentomutase [Desulfitobacterium dichloroeliminans LMG P-21439]